MRMYPYDHVADWDDQIYNLQFAICNALLPRTPLPDPLLRQIVAQVGDAAGVAPLVVVPGERFDHGAADDEGVERAEDGGVGVALEVAGDERLLAVGQDAFHGAFGSLAHGRVHGL